MNLKNKCVSSVRRLQPPSAMVLHDLLHHPARAPGLARHERVQEEVRPGVGRVLPNCSVQDHSSCLLRKQPSGTPELRPTPSTTAVKAFFKIPNLSDLTF